MLLLIVLGFYLKLTVHVFRINLWLLLRTQVYMEYDFYQGNYYVVQLYDYSIRVSVKDNVFIFENYSRSELIWLASHQQPIFVLLISRAKSTGFFGVPAF